MVDAAQEDSPELAELASSLRSSFQTIEDVAYSFVREAIMRGHFRPGQRLPQDSIGDLLQVSRMPVRAAIRRLEADGLVVFEAHRGATVRTLTAAEINEIYDLRILVESYLIDRAVDGITDQLLDELLDELDSIRSETDSTVWLNRRNRLYERLYETADAPRALAMMLELRTKVGAYLVLRRERSTVVDHVGVLSYLRERDANGAKAWIATHLKEVAEDLELHVATAFDEVEEPTELNPP